MAENEKNSSKNSRRTFFAGMGLVVATGVAAKVVAPESVSTLTQALTPKGPDDNNYRLSEHVKKYYRTTTI